MSESVSKAVLITGCSSGIGAATAERLAQAGWKVYATARRPETIEGLREKGCDVLALDVCDEDSMRAAVERVEGAAGAVGVLINNAGYSQSGAVEEVPPEQVRRQFDTNVFGLVRLTQLVLPGMRRQGYGKVVNISSMGGKAARRSACACGRWTSAGRRARRRGGPTLPSAPARRGFRHAAAPGCRR